MHKLAGAHLSTMILKDITNIEEMEETVAYSVEIYRHPREKNEISL